MRGMMSSRKRRRRSRRSMRCALVVVAVMCILTSIAISLLRLADRRMIPVALAIAGEHIRARTNAIYQAALEDVVKTRGLVSDDFYIKTTDEEGRLADLSVNTLLVNAVCAELAVRISEGLATDGEDIVEVPLGTLLDIRILANHGTRCRIRVRPMGGVNVDYESSFTSAGINQVNFQIWLKIESSAQVINPLQDGEIRMTRHVPLVNTVFAGQIPTMVFAPNSMGGGS